MKFNDASLGSCKKANRLHIAHLENITTGIIVHKKGLGQIIALN